MNHGLMNGMFWAGVLLSSIPVLLGVGIAVYVFRIWQTQRVRTQPPEVTSEELVP
jgi:hypothetical protein